MFIIGCSSAQVRQLTCWPEMFAIIGILVVFGAVLGGYLMEHGSVAVLLQPAELLIIGGAAGEQFLSQTPCTF